MKSYKISEINYKRILGRTSFDNKSDSPLCLFWGASALEINVKAEEVWLEVSSNYDTHEPWLSIEVNGAPIARFMVEKGAAKWVCLARNLNPQKENLISIIKDTQAMSGDLHHSLFIHSIGLSENATFCPLKERKMNIEFLGDSITSGEGLAGSPDEMEWITQWFCASKTYALQLSKALNANYSVLSQCGWGICWGWDGNVNAALPAHYENICSVIGGDYQASLGACEKFNFDVKNDFVIINLGTNDNGAFFQPPWKDENGVEHILHLDEKGKVAADTGKIIIDGVKAFLKNIRKHNAEAKIIWTYGMIKLSALPECISAAIEEYKKESSDKNVYLLELDSMEDLEVNLEDKGSRGHPGPKTHRMAAEKLFKFIKGL